MDKDYYKILEVNSNASDDDIKKSYKKLARKWHPDRNNENSEKSEKKFKEISLAYTVLSDPNERRKYDMRKFTPEHTRRDFSFNEADNLFNNIFSSNLNNPSFNRPHHPFNHNFHNNYKKKKIQKSDLLVTLKELYTGVKKKIKITRKILEYNNIVNSSKILEIDILPGWKDGTKITFENEGDVDIVTKETYDLVFIIKTMPHNLFKRNGNDLIIEKEISLLESLCGLTYTFQYLDETELQIDLSDQIIQYGFQKKLYGKGMPIRKNNSFGNLIINFTIKYPNIITETQKQKLRECLL